ncbi:MAG: hypothetical protein ACFCA4_02965 [Cyanophyceae cyanobacterium]
MIKTTFQKNALQKNALQKIIQSLLGAIATASVLTIQPVHSDPPPITDSPITEEPLFDDPDYVKACEFAVDISAGVLAGNRFYGTFSFGDASLTGQGQEVITPEDGLKISMYYLGRTYEHTDDRNYPDYPRVTLQDGKVELVDFWVDPRDRDIWWTGVPGWDVQLTRTDCEIKSSTQQSAK